MLPIRLEVGGGTSGVNGSATAFQKPIFHGENMIVFLAMAELKKNVEHNSCSLILTGRNDLKAAYKQVPLFENVGEHIRLLC